MQAKIFWRTTDTLHMNIQVESAEEAERHMEWYYGPLWHVQYKLFVEVVPKRKPARRGTK